MKDVALDIALELINNTTNTEEAMDIYDLVESGVSGTLLREVLQYLTKFGYVVDTHFSESFKKVAENNIRECKNILSRSEIPSVRAELDLLQAKPNILLGVMFGTVDNIRTEADSGIPLLINKYGRTSTSLMKLSGSASQQVILVDGEIVSFDASMLDHKNMN